MINIYNKYNIYIIYIYIYIYLYMYIYTFMWTLIVVFTAAEGGLMEPTVAAVRRLDLCGCSKQR